MKLIKYVKLFLGFRDIQKAWKEEKGVDRPKGLSRAFIGIVATFLGAVLLAVFEIKLDQNIIAQIIDSLDKLVGAVIILYGIVMMIAKAIKGAKKKPNGNLSDDENEGLGLA